MAKLILNQLSIGKYNAKIRQYIHTFTCKNCKQPRKASRPLKQVYISGFCVPCANKEKFNKPITLKFYNKGKLWSYPSITAFCKPRQASLGKTAKYHFAEVLNGTRLHYKGWMLPNHPEIDSKKVKLIEQLSIKKAIVE